MEFIELGYVNNNIMFLLERMIHARILGPCTPTPAHFQVLPERISCPSPLNELQGVI